MSVSTAATVSSAAVTRHVREKVAFLTGITGQVWPHGKQLLHTGTSDCHVNQ